MSFFDYAAMTVITLIGIKYLVDMIRFAMGYEINGKRREPMFTLSFLSPVPGSAEEEENVIRFPEEVKAAS